MRIENSIWSLEEYRAHSKADETKLKMKRVTEIIKNANVDFHR